MSTVASAAPGADRDRTARRQAGDLELHRRYRDHGDLQAREQLVRRFEGLVRSVAGRYAGSGEPHEDVVQAGMLGLAKAIERFEPRRGKPFVSYATPNISGEIKRHFRDHCWAVHVPRSTQELELRLRQARSAGTHASGREPTLEQLAVSLAVSIDRVREARTAGAARISESLDQPHTDGRTVHDVRGCVDAGYARVDDADLIEDAVSVLDETAREVVLSRYREDLLQRDIALRIGSSQMQVSRTLSRSTDRMRAHMTRPGSGGARP